jgi:UDP-glucose 4-epimerase
MLKVAVIGSNGFIGRHLIGKISKAKNCEVVLFGRSDVSNNRGPYHKLELDKKVQLRDQLRDCTFLYYLASETIPASSWNDAQSEIYKNLIPFLQVSEVAVEAGIKKIIFLSSAGTIYGPSKTRIPEDANKMPFSPYGITKLTMEYFLNYFEARHDLHFEIFRISNVFGEGQDTSKGLGIINTFLEQILKGQKIRVFGDGRHTRNYIYVKDVAELLTLPLNTDISRSGIYNLSSNNTLSVNQIIELIRNTVSEPFEVEYLNGRASDNEFIDLDNSRLLSRAGNFDFTPIQDAISHTYQHLKQIHKIAHK